MKDGAIGTSYRDRNKFFIYKAVCCEKIKQDCITFYAYLVLKIIEWSSLKYSVARDLSYLNLVNLVRKPNKSEN